MLRGIQLNSLEDRAVSEKQQWDTAVKFLETSVKEKLIQTENTLNEMFGPGNNLSIHRSIDISILPPHFHFLFFMT